MYSANASKITSNSKMFKILQLIILNNGATKYECITTALGVVGSNQKLRGYYSCTFRGLVNAGVLCQSKTSYKYYITADGISKYVEAANR
jgi:predicted transcriptional regulator